MRRVVLLASACLGTTVVSASATDSIPVFEEFELASRAHPPARSRIDLGLGVPLIVSYEQAKLRAQERTASRDPRLAWVRQVAEAVGIAVRQASATGVPGVAKVTFTLGRSGHILRKSVTATSGNNALDRLALDVVGKAEPFPNMPSEVVGESATFTLPVRLR